MVQMLFEWLKQLGSTVGVLCLCGLMIWILSRLFYKQAGNYSPKICVATGLIGTPIHELGHAVFCLVFFHKITEIKLFQPNSDDGTIGYVSHSYRKTNIYQQLGNFFIGVGPILFGTGVLSLLMWLMIPDTLSGLFQTSETASGGNADFFATLGNAITSFFAVENLKNYLFWIFLIVAILIALHMSLSPQDIKGSVIGFLLFLVISFVAELIVFLISKPTMYRITDFCMTVGAMEISLMMVPVCALIVLVLIILLFKLILRR